LIHRSQRVSILPNRDWRSVIVDFIDSHFSWFAARDSSSSYWISLMWVLIRFNSSALVDEDSDLQTYHEYLSSSSLITYVMSVFISLSSAVVWSSSSCRM
jgi:hypothetical protein